MLADIRRHARHARLSLFFCFRQFSFPAVGKKTARKKAMPLAQFHAACGNMDETEHVSPSYSRGLSLSEVQTADMIVRESEDRKQTDSECEDPDCGSHVEVELIPSPLGIEPLRFFVIADWGYPSPDVRSVAWAMDRRAQAMRPQFILALGDNFYPSGVSSISDRKFQSFWQDVFLCYESLNVPWQVCLGNHDYEGNPQAQIDFTHCDRNPGKLWQCPSKNYKFSSDLPGGGSVDLFALDTNACQYDVRCNYPLADMKMHDYVAELQEGLEASTAAWKIVFGHHPVHNRGLRDLDEGERLREVYGVERALESGGAHAYFCGHEHAFQHHHVSGVDHFGCGAADAVGLGLLGGCKPIEVSHPGWIDENHAGFVEVALTARRMEVSFVSTRDGVIHSIQRER